MIETEKLYEVATQELANLDRQINALMIRYAKLPSPAFATTWEIIREAICGGNTANTRKKEMLSNLVTLVQQGIPYIQEPIINATPLSFAVASKKITQKAINILDTEITKDINSKEYIVYMVNDIPVGLPYPTIPMSHIPVRGYAHAEEKTQKAIKQAIWERDIMRNLARVLKAGMQPELISLWGTTPTRIDKIAVDPSMITQGKWLEITDTAARALLPISCDEHVIKPGRNSSEYGIALLKYGDNRDGRSPNPVYAIYKNYGNSRKLQPYDTQSAAEAAYYKEISTKNGKQITHTRADNFNGGNFAYDQYHPHSAVGFSDPASREIALTQWGADRARMAEDFGKASSPKGRSSLLQRQSPRKKLHC